MLRNLAKGNNSSLYDVLGSDGANVSNFCPVKTDTHITELLNEHKYLKSRIKEIEQELTAKNIKLPY